MKKIYNKRKVKSPPSSPIEKVSTSEKNDETEEDIQFKKPPKKSTRRKLHDENDTRRYSTSVIQIVSHLLDVPDAVTIQYQEGGELAVGTQSVLLQVSIPSYQNITEGAVIEAEVSRLKEGQVVEEVVPKRPFLGYYQGTVGLFEEPVQVLSEKYKSEQGTEIPAVWPSKMVYGITSSASSDEERYKQIVANKLAKDEEKDVQVSLVEFTDTIQG